MSIESALIANLEGNLDGQFASLSMPAIALSATYTWGGTSTVTTSDTSEVVAGEFIRLDSDGNWYQIQSIVPNTSVTVLDTYSLGSFPSGSTQSSKARISPPAPLSGTGGVDPFAEGIANAFASEPHELPSYTVAGVPSASPAGRLIYVSNETGGAVLAFSDGTNWRRVTDRAVIS